MSQESNWRVGWGSRIPWILINSFRKQYNNRLSLKYDNSVLQGRIYWVTSFFFPHKGKYKVWYYSDLGNFSAKVAETGRSVMTFIFVEVKSFQFRSICKYGGRCVCKLFPDPIWKMKTFLTPCSLLFLGNLFGLVQHRSRKSFKACVLLYLFQEVFFAQAFKASFC